MVLLDETAVVQPAPTATTSPTATASPAAEGATAAPGATSLPFQSGQALLVFHPGRDPITAEQTAAGQALLEAGEELRGEARGAAQQGVRARPRILQKRAPPRGGARGPADSSKSSRCTTESGVSPATRIADPQFANDGFIVDASNTKRVWCSGCKVSLGTKLNVLQQHARSQKHKKKLEAARKKALKFIEINKQLERAAAADVQVAGGARGTLSDRTVARRISVVEGFLRAGVPLAKIDPLRPVLEEGCTALTSASHLYEFIPIIQKAEVERVKMWAADEDVALLWDGATFGGELLAIVGKKMNPVSFMPEARRWGVNGLHSSHTLTRSHTVSASGAAYVRVFIHRRAACAGGVTGGVPVEPAAGAHLRDAARPHLEQRSGLPHAVDHAVERRQPGMLCAHAGPRGQEHEQPAGHRLYVAPA